MAKIVINKRLVVLFFSSATLSSLFHRRAFKTAGETEKYFMVFLLLLTSALDPERPRPLPLRLGTFYIFSFHIIFHHRDERENTVLFLEPLHIFGWKAKEMDLLLFRAFYRPRSARPLTMEVKNSADNTKVLCAHDILLLRYFWWDIKIYTHATREALHFYIYIFPNAVEK